MITGSAILLICQAKKSPKPKQKKNHPALETIQVGYSQEKGYFIAVHLIRPLLLSDPPIPPKIGSYPIQVYEPHPNRPDIVDRGL